MRTYDEGFPLDGIWHNVPELGKVHNRSQTYSIKFTYADLSPENIMVKSCSITGIIEWEFSGWYPEYWEYTKIYYGWRPYREDFYHIFDRFTKTYPAELAAEREIWKRLNTFSYDLPLPTASTVQVNPRRMSKDSDAKFQPTSLQPKSKP